VNPYHEVFAHQADVVFRSTTALPDHEATLRQIMDKGRAAVMVATAGALGGYLLVRGEDEIRRFRAAPLAAPAVDSNGAGDAFVAGFLFGYLAGESVDACCRLGAVAGAHACTVPGTDVSPIGKVELRRRAAARQGQ
jgi:sugar/nucleoside kinase (ribokinase family)